ncbi:MAG: hypothetical protein ABI679_01300 [Gemmatimonadota bacterium]
MIRPTSAATVVAQQLWDREQVDHASPEAVAAVVERVSGYLRIGISRWIGADGYRILMERALAEAEVNHPFLASLHSLGTHSNGTADVVRRKGAAEVEQGFVTLVGLMVDRLGRVVGDEMAGRLVEQSWSDMSRRRRDIKSEGIE